LQIKRTAKPFAYFDKVIQKERAEVKLYVVRIVFDKLGEDHHPDLLQDDHEQIFLFYNAAYYLERIYLHELILI
jgi:hypothetical protein